MKVRILILLLILALTVSSCTKVEKAPIAVDGNIEDIAVDLVMDLSGGNFDRAFQEYYYTNEVENNLNESAYKRMWNSLTQSNGSFKEISGFSFSKSQGYDMVSVETAFEKAKLNINIVFDTNKLIAGINYKPYTEPKKMPENITETLFEFGEAGFRLNGVITEPKDPSQHGSPIVILVHGSGPSDRDETIGDNKPFRDIAWGLAQRGIRTIRYDKRTYTYGKEMGKGQHVTVNEETIDDAVNAAEYLMLSSSIFPGDIYILGHSLGGMLIPRISSRVVNVSGFIMMAAPATPLEDLMVEQIKYISKLDEFTTSLERKTIRDYENMRDNIKELSDISQFSTDELFNVPASYWLDLKSYDPIQAAKNIEKPLFILQGERDYQVTMKDFYSWQKALEEKENVTFKSYEGLNHLMMIGTEKSSPAEYETAGEVDKRIIDDIASWILSSS